MNQISAVIACGGSSSRMKTDKFALEYHGKSHACYLYEMLSLIFPGRVFISCTSGQVKFFENKYRIIIDKKEFAGHGPVSGLLSAFDFLPNDSLLFFGCDYPFLDLLHIQLLLEKRNPDVYATSFMNIDGVVEPLLCLYENKCAQQLRTEFESCNYSLRVFLQKNKIETIQDVYNTLISADTPIQYINAKKIISGTGNDQ
jgi:molybdopterin-guanine dinucleotide biosynthesis protein A